MGSTGTACNCFLVYSLVLLALCSVACDAGPRFVLKHRSSGYCYDFTLSTWVFRFRYWAAYCPAAFQLEWVQSQGHLGYLKIVGISQVAGDFCLRPYYGSMNPDDNTSLYPLQNCHNSALFSIDQEHGHIRHVGGKYVSPYPHNYDTPYWHTQLVLHSEKNINNRFDFVKQSDQNARVTVIPRPEVTGSWEKVMCWYNVHRGSLGYKVTIGTSKKSSTSLTNNWEVSVSAAKGIISASAKYSGSFTTAYESQWRSESTVDRRINIHNEGGDICLWQWTYSFRQFGDQFTFKSFTIRETRSDIRPTQIPRSKK